MLTPTLVLTTLLVALSVVSTCNDHSQAYTPALDKQVLGRQLLQIQQHLKQPEFQTLLDREYEAWHTAIVLRSATAIRYLIDNSVLGELFAGKIEKRRRNKESRNLSLLWQDNGLQALCLQMQEAHKQWILTFQKLLSAAQIELTDGGNQRISSFSQAIHQSPESFFNAWANSSITCGIYTGAYGSRVIDGEPSYYWTAPPSEEDKAHRAALLLLLQATTDEERQEIQRTYNLPTKDHFSCLREVLGSIIPYLG